MNMKSIEDTLSLIDRIIHSFGREKLYIALAGGYATIAHGVERTTADIDFCIYADLIQKGNSKNIQGLISLLQGINGNWKA